MGKWPWEDHVFWLFMGPLIVFLIWLFVVGIPYALENKRQFVEACTQAGGVPSKYETMVGKTSVSERLCIKKENIVEIGG